LLGACWLIWRTEGELQARFRPLARALGFTLTGFIGAVSISMLFLSEAFREHWLTFPNIIWAAPVPAFVLLLVWAHWSSSGISCPPYARLGCFSFRISAWQSACGP
jgi:cytochrome bd-type quinol oxidase subunit 2